MLRFSSTDKELERHFRGMSADDSFPNQPLVIELDSLADGPSVDELMTYPAPTIGVSPHPFNNAIARAFDVLITPMDPTSSHPSDSPGWVFTEPEAELERLEHSIVMRQVASRMFVQLTRMIGNLSPSEVLLAESLTFSVLLGGREFRHWLHQARLPSSKSSENSLLVDQEGDMVLISLNRPEAANALNMAMRDALTDVLQAVNANDPEHLKIVVTGLGPNFCSGGDLAEFGTADDLAMAHVVRTARGPAQLMWKLRDSIEVEVQGACIGAGLELAALAREIRATDDAWFSLPELSMGLIPGAGGTLSIPMRIGRQRANWLALSGATIDAQNALSWGLVDSVISSL